MVANKISPALAAEEKWTALERARRATEATVALDAPLGTGSSVAAHAVRYSQAETLWGLSDTVLTCLRHLSCDEACSVDSQLGAILSQITSLRSEAEVLASGQSGPSLPHQIGQYQLLEKLGEGGMGTVYKALHASLKRQVAVKLLPACNARSPQAMARFHREMEAVGRLDHPNIVRAFDAGQAGGQAFLVMEFVEGVDLSSLVRCGEPLGMADACEIIRQAAAGLQHAHEHGVVHRDVKPSNLLLSNNGVVKLLDLGLARLSAKGDSPIFADQCRPSVDGARSVPAKIGTVPGEAMADDRIMGSPDYMAPEQSTDPRKVDARADVYALGCTLYFLLGGRPPFGDEQHTTVVEKIMAHTNNEILPIQQLRPEVPGALVAILDSMLAKDRTVRFASAAEVVKVLTPFVAGNDLAGLLKSRAISLSAANTSPSNADDDATQRLPEVSQLPSDTASSSRNANLIGLGLLALGIAARQGGIASLVGSVNDAGLGRGNGDPGCRRSRHQSCLGHDRCNPFRRR